MIKVIWFPVIVNFNYSHGLITTFYNVNDATEFASATVEALAGSRAWIVQNGVVTVVS